MPRSRLFRHPFVRGSLRVCVLVAASAALVGCTEPVDCSAEPSRCVPQQQRPPLKLPAQGTAAPFDSAKARADLLRLGRNNGMRPVDAAGEARLRSGAGKAAAALLRDAAPAAPAAPAPSPMPPDAMARAGALPSDTLAARRRPDAQALAAAKLPTAPTAQAGDDARLAELRRFFKLVAGLVGDRSLDKLAPVLHPDYLTRLREVVPANEARFWTHATRYASMLGGLPANGAGMQLTIQPGSSDSELQLQIEPTDGKLPLRPIVVREGAGWKLRRF